MTRRIQGDVLKLRCSQCAATFHNFQFSGDTDAITAGLAAVTSLRGDEVAVSEMTGDEWRDQASGMHRFARRISQALKREFRAAPLVCDEDVVSNPPEVSFQKFRRLLTPRGLVFSCPLCAGAAVVIARETPAEFMGKGGALTLYGQLELG